MRTKALFILVILALLSASCNLPAGNSSVPSAQPPGSTIIPEAGVDAVGTSVALTAAVVLTQAAGSVVPPTVMFTDTPAPTSTNTATITPCVPMVTATTNANVRSGPDIAYAVVGSLTQGGTALVTGRNDASTWWYIEYGSSHAWIAGSVTAASCLPVSVQIVAAPPLPTVPSPTNTLPPPVAGLPDLVASGMQYWPDPARNNQPVAIQVKVTNNGTAPAGQFTVVWLSNQSLPGCSWTVSGLGIGASKNLECEFTYNGHPSADYWITLVVDARNQLVELDEGNNERDGTLLVR